MSRRLTTLALIVALAVAWPQGLVHLASHMDALAGAECRLDAPSPDTDAEHALTGSPCPACLSLKAHAGALAPRGGPAAALPVERVAVTDTQQELRAFRHRGPSNRAPPVAC